MTRNGKIARLPAVVREELNVRLDEGEPGRDLVAWLNALPKVQAIVNRYFQGYAVTEQNLSEWRRGGFEDWRGQQASIESTRTLAEHSDELQLQSNGGDLRPTRYRSYADRLAVLLSVDVFEHRQTVMQKEMDPKLRWELLKELLQQVNRLRKDDHRQARLMLDQKRCEQKEEREVAAAKEVQAEKQRSQQEQSYWALLRWGPLVQMFGGGDLGKFFADAILRLQTGADPVEVPEHLKADLEAFKESLAKGGSSTSEQEPESANRTESDSIQVHPTGNTDGTESRSTACPGSDAKTHHLSPALSPAQGGGEGEESRGNAIQQPKIGLPFGGNPTEASGPTVAGQAGQPVGPSAHSIAPNRTGSDPIRVDPIENPVGADGQTIAGQVAQQVGPSDPSIAPNRTESDLIRVDPVVFGRVNA